jgi:hypothetical protein
LICPSISSKPTPSQRLIVKRKNRKGQSLRFSLRSTNQTAAQKIQVKRLRKKFKVVDAFDMIETLYGVNYRFKEI